MDERIGFGIYQSCGNRGSVGRVSVYGLRGVGGDWVWLGTGCRIVGWCFICASCESGLFVYKAGPRYMYIVLGGYLRILGAPNVKSCCTLSISASY